MISSGLSISVIVDCYYMWGKWKYFLIRLYFFILYKESMKWKQYERLHIVMYDWGWKSEGCYV